MTQRLCSEEEVKAWLRGSKEGRQPGWTPPFFSRGVEILKQGKLKDCVLNDTRDGATATCLGARVKRQHARAPEADSCPPAGSGVGESYELSVRVPPEGAVEGACTCPTKARARASGRDSRAQPPSMTEF